MPIWSNHHMILSHGETVMCTKCKQFKGHLDEMFLTTHQSGEGDHNSSEVTETTCRACHMKETK